MGDACGHLASCGLPDAWQGAQSWTVLDTDFAERSQFFATLSRWQNDPSRPRCLHYVGIYDCRGEADTRMSGTRRDAPGSQRIDQLILRELPNVGRLGRGFHRFALESGQVLLTVCVGSTQDMLREGNFQADTVFAKPPENQWEARLLARRCKPGSLICFGTQASANALNSELYGVMEPLGFIWQTDSAGQRQPSCTFDPPWRIRNLRDTRHLEVRSTGRCAVVGAGIAGACVAYALARRGWEVAVVDQEVAPAAGASGLPAGLLVPHVSADDSPRSRLSRHGARMMTDLAHGLLVRGEDWAPSGVTERRTESVLHWHPDAGWIRPSRLVRALLSHANVSFVGLTSIQSLVYRAGHWQLGCQNGDVPGNFDLVVLANAMGSVKLLRQLACACGIAPDLDDKLAAVHAVHGAINFGRYAEPMAGLPTAPVNGHGYFIPHLPDPSGAQWLIGSTFETDALRAADLWQQRVDNFAHLAHLVPPDGDIFAQTLDRGPVAQWLATRCVTHDRLPLVGPVDVLAHPGLWLCVGMGSRGLSFSALCAELIAARIGAEPWPIEASLARSLDVHRIKKKRTPDSGPPFTFAATPQPRVVG
ncbi:MAG: FAD-dependent oxidoreductase [Rhodoferax sp.]|nr:FAD-dependent oxidoreductase [Rhodoferax sp.]